MKRMAAKAGLGVTKKHFTNHSMRSTTVKKLKKGWASSREIMAITGHRSEQSLAAYDHLDLDDHRQLSHIISGNPPQAKLQPAAGTSHQPDPCLSSLSSAPVIFQNCNVYFGANTHTSSLSFSVNHQEASLYYIRFWLRLTVRTHGHQLLLMHATIILCVSHHANNSYFSNSCNINEIILEVYD